MTSNCSSSEARFCSSLRTSQPATATAAAQYSSQRETSVDQDEDGDADEETDLTVHRQAGDDHDDVVDFVAAGHGRPSLLVTYDHHHQQRQQQLSSNGRGNSCCYWSDQEGEEDDEEEEEEDEEEDEGAPVSSSVSSSSTSLKLGGGDSLLQLETPVDEEEEGVVGVVVGGGEDTQAELQLIRRCLEVDPVERSVQQVALLHAYIDRHGFFWPQVSGPEARRRLARFLVLAVIESQQQQQQQLILSEGELLDSLCVLIHGRVQVHESSATSSSTSQQHGRGFAFGFLGQERSGHSLYSARGPAGACCWFLCVSHFDLLSQVQPEQQQQHHHPYHPATQQSKTQQQQQEEDPKTPAKEGGEEQQQQRLLSGGELVLHLVAPERNNAGPRWQVARGSRRALLAHMLLTDDSGSDCVGADDSFRELMLLSFRAFPRGDSSAAEPKPLSELMGFLVDQAAASGELQAVVLRTVLLWLQNHYLDFEQEGAEGEGLLGQLRQGLEPRLAHSGQLVALLHLALSAKARPRTVQLTRSTRSEPLPFQLVGGYERGGAIFVSSSSSSTGSSRLLQVGDELLSVNGHSFACMPLAQAYSACATTTHLALTVKQNPYAYGQMVKALASKSGRLADLQHRPAVPEPSPRHLTTPKEPETGGGGGIREKVKRSLQQLLSGGGGASSSSVAAPTSQVADVQQQQPLGGGSGEEQLVLKVHHGDTWRLVALSSGTTARECVMVALRLFPAALQARCSLHFALYCVSLSPVLEPGGATSFVVKRKRLPDGATDLWHSQPLHSKYVLRDLAPPATADASAASTADSDSAVREELLKQVGGRFPLTLLDVSLHWLACQLTHQDWTLFSALEPQQLLTAVVLGSADDQSQPQQEEKQGDQLRQWERRSELQMFWVVSEVLDAKAGARRLQTAKRFVRLAKALVRLRNYNAAFAVLSGLGHGSVQRLRASVWDKMAAKWSRVYGQLLALLDPSRNMARYRQLLLQRPREPMIPFYPVHKKDLTFLHLATPTELPSANGSGGRLVNVDKFRSLGREIRLLLGRAAGAGNSYPYGPPCPSSSGEGDKGKLLAEQVHRKKASVYLGAAFKRVLFDEALLQDKSLAIEGPPPAAQATTQAGCRPASASTTATTTAAPAGDSASWTGSASSLSSSSLHSNSVSSSSNNANASTTPRFGLESPASLHKLLSLQLKQAPVTSLSSFSRLQLQQQPPASVSGNSYHHPPQCLSSLMPQQQQPSSSVYYLAKSAAAASGQQHLSLASHHGSSASGNHHHHSHHHSQSHHHQQQQLSSTMGRSVNSGSSSRLPRESSSVRPSLNNCIPSSLPGAVQSPPPPLPPPSYEETLQRHHHRKQKQQQHSSKPRNLDSVV